MTKVCTPLADIRHECSTNNISHEDKTVVTDAIEYLDCHNTSTHSMENNTHRVKENSYTCLVNRPCNMHKKLAALVINTSCAIVCIYVYGYAKIMLNVFLQLQQSNVCHLYVYLFLV